MISWILNSVNREIADSLATARDIWIDLRDRFHQSNAPRIFQIKKILGALQQGSMDVSAYYTRLRTLWDELKGFQPVSICNYGSMKEWVKHQNQESVSMGLNELYSHTRAHILLMDPIPTIAKIFSLVVQGERQRSIHIDVPSGSLDRNSQVYSSANATVGKGFSAGKGGKIDKVITCSHCHFPGHTVDKCYRLHGYAPGHRKYKQKSGDDKFRVNQTRSSLSNDTGLLNCTQSDKTSSDMGYLLSSEQCKQLIAFMSSKLQHGYRTISETQQAEPYVSCFSGTISVSQKSTSILDTDWVLDTGATHHICSSLSLFHFYKPTHSAVTLPNNSVTQTFIGFVQLSPSLTFILIISISSLTKQIQRSVNFLSESCIIQALNKDVMIGMGNRVGNLYVLNTSSLSPVICNVFSIQTTLWHYRMCHPHCLNCL